MAYWRMVYHLPLYRVLRASGLSGTTRAGRETRGLVVWGLRFEVGGHFLWTLGPLSSSKLLHEVLGFRFQTLEVGADIVGFKVWNPGEAGGC